jgi:hypothetical protein
VSSGGFWLILLDSGRFLWILSVFGGFWCGSDESNGV